MNDNPLEYQWPSDFPTGFPENQLDVIPACGTACRLVDRIPPSRDDFQRHRDEKHDYNYNTERKRLLSYGVSFWTTPEAAKLIKAKYPAPEQFGRKKIVSGEFVPTLGVILREEEHNPHLTLLMQVGAEPHNHFTHEVEE